MEALQKLLEKRIGERMGPALIELRKINEEMKTLNINLKELRKAIEKLHKDMRRGKIG